MLRLDFAVKPAAAAGASPINLLASSGATRTAADEGQTRPRIALARFYAAGLGVPKDMARAIALLKATPHEEAQRLLQELSAGGEAVSAPTRP